MTERQQPFKATESPFDPRRASLPPLSPRGSSADEARRCSRCGETQPLTEFSVDRSKSSGRKSQCLRCDRERSARYYLENREAVLAREADRRSYARPSEPRVCSECGAELTGQQRVTCGLAGCRDRRFRQLQPDAYAAREAAKGGAAARAATCRASRRGWIVGGYRNRVAPRAITDQKSRQAMRATKRPTLNRLGSAALRAKRGSMRLADRACGTKRSLRSPRQARRPRLSLGELCACRRLADGLHAAVWVTANSRLIAAARAWISARLRSILASCFSPLASQRRARSSWIRAASSCRSTRHRPTAVSVPPVIPPPYVVPPHNVVRTGYTPAAPPTLGDVRSGLWSHLGADPHAHTPSCRSGHREDTDDDGDQLPPRIFATAGDAKCDHSKHGGDGGSGCRYPQVVAAREPAGDKAGREDGQRPQWERRGQPKDREHDKEPDENRDRSKPPHPSIVGASAALVNPCDLANNGGNQGLQAFGLPPDVLLQERGPEFEKVGGAVLENAQDRLAVVNGKRDPVLVGEPVVHTDGCLGFAGQHQPMGNLEHPVAGTWMPATSITLRSAQGSLIM